MSTFSAANPVSANQFKKPSGAAGRITGWIMSWQNRRLNRLAVDYLAIDHDDTVLEIGFGSGIAIELLTKHSGVRRICGIDSFSDTGTYERTFTDENGMTYRRDYIPAFNTFGRGAKHSVKRPKLCKRRSRVPT